MSMPLEIKEKLEAMKQDVVLYYPIFAKIVGHGETGMILSSMMKEYRTVDKIYSNKKRIFTKEELSKFKKRFKRIDFLKKGKDSDGTYFEIVWSKSPITKEQIIQDYKEL